MAKTDTRNYKTTSYRQQNNLRIISDLQIITTPRLNKKYVIVYDLV